jgi:AraC-like DNA-binding protein
VELELNLVADGTISYVVEGKRYSFGKRTLLWLFPRQEHQLVDRTSDAQYYVAVFKPGLIGQSCTGERYAQLLEAEPAGGGVLHTELPAEDFDLLKRTMDAILADGIDADLLNREAGFGISPAFSFRHYDPDWLNAGLHHLLLLCWRHQQGRARGPAKAELHPAVEKALRWMDEADHDGPPLHRRCGVSKAHLSRLFHQQIGVPISRYRNSIRLSRFWEAYRRKENRTLLEAVYAAGFGSYAQFYRVYREAYGEGPRKSLSR